MARAIIAVMDSFGIGSAPDAERFGDAGASTLGHIAKACAAGEANIEGIREGPLHIPALLELGLGEAAVQASGGPVALPVAREIQGCHGFAAERSFGKDTPSGHWEMMGLPVEFDWGYFKARVQSFPTELIDRFVEEAELPGVLGDCHASGTVIIEELGEEHIQSGKPIVYTSADSVFQIAAHEEHFGLQRLYRICEIARRLVDDYNIGRVIARPFVGEEATTFRRTSNRKDYATPPHGPTLLDIAKEHGRDVIGLGKISDIFAGSGLTQSIKASGNDALFDALLSQVAAHKPGSLVFANFVDFDTEFGHRRNVAGYAAALEAFDRRLPSLISALQTDDLLILTADHGCDPTWVGTDHTREYVPVLATGPQIAAKDIGCRDTFADIGQTCAEHLGLPPVQAGSSFLSVS